MDLATVNKNRNKFVSDFTTDMGKILKVKTSRIGITGIKAGSVRSYFACPAVAQQRSPVRYLCP
eukprot:COSAG01_NODE_5002_length_4552_cov_22.563320_3_plen_64_part_00